MEKQLFGNLPPDERVQYLHDNCEKIEEIGYMKNFTPDELMEMKERLSDVSIEINDISVEKAEAMRVFKDRLKPHESEKSKLLSNLKLKAEYVDEECYKFVDEADGMVGYYNEVGELVSSRPILPTERQKNIFRIGNTGTNT